MRCRSVVLIALLGGLPVAALEPPVSKEAMRSVQESIAEQLVFGDQVQLALVIKGGASLGAYESGANWTLLNYLRSLEAEAMNTPGPTLRAAAGASAGAINGVLTAAYWCRARVAEQDNDCQPADKSMRPGASVCDSIDRNIFRDAWIDVDIMDLLATDGRNPDGLVEDNAVFSRAPLRAAAGRVQAYMAQPGFRSNCSVPIGITLTRADPVRLDNAGLQVSNQRLVAPLRLVTAADNTLDVRTLPLATDDEALNQSVIYLDDNRAAGHSATWGKALWPATLFEAVKASSSFPVAFAPMKLDYCIRFVNREGEGLRGYTRSGPDSRCPPQFRRQTSYFVDGGVFDNDPVGVVRHLSEATDTDSGTTLYINIDPGNRRLPRALRQVSITPFSRGGDSLQIELVTGDPPRDPDQPYASVATQPVTVHRCDASGSLKTELTRSLYATGQRTRRYVGSLHLGDPDDGCASRPFQGDVLPVCVGDEIRVYDDGAPTTPCAPRVQDPLTGETRIDYAYSEIVAAEPQGLTTQLGFIGGAVQSARGSELFREIVGERWRDGFAVVGRQALNRPAAAPGSGGRPIFQAARLTPLSGDYIFAFGAFLDKRFREFDYYAGVYDALYGLAEFACQQSLDPGDTCLADRFRLIYATVCPSCQSADSYANVVIRHLIELDTCGEEAIVFGRRDCKPPAWRWIDEYPPLAVPALFDGQEGCRSTRDKLPADRLSEALAVAGLDAEDPRRVQHELRAIGRALVCADRRTRDRQRDPFVAYIRQLAEDPRFQRERVERGGESVETPIGRMLARYKRSVPTWYYPLAQTAVAQLLPLEVDDIALRESHLETRSTNSGLAKTVLALGGLISETSMADRRGWQTHLSSIPPGAGSWSRWAPALPNELALDTRNGGFALFWEAGWRSGTLPFGVSLRATPYLQHKFGEQTQELAEVTSFANIYFNGVLLSSVGIGPSYSYNWSDPLNGKRENLGATAYAGLLGDKLRLSYGERTFSNADFEGDEAFWQLSVRDLPGLLYWGLQAN